MENKQQRVLVVEDEPGLAELFEIWLQSDFSVTVVTDGEDALQRIDDGFDAIVLDWRMPAVSGEDVVSAIVERELDLAVVVVTGLDPAVADVDERVNRVLCKPIEEATLVAAVRESLR